MPKRKNNRNTTPRNGLSFIIILTITTYYAISSRMRRIGSTSVTNYHSSLSSFIQDHDRGTINSESSTFHNEKVWPKPYGWESYSYTLIRKHFSCHEYVANDKNKELPTLRDWHLFQSQYNKMVDATRSFHDPVPPTMGYTLTTNGTINEGGTITSPLPPPYHAKYSTDNNGHRCRGIFASRNIKKGELVHDGTHSNILFPDGMSWRRFIFSLPRNRACDMIDWTWAQKIDEEEEEVASSSSSSPLAATPAVEKGLLFNNSSHPPEILTDKSNLSINQQPLPEKSLFNSSHHRSNLSRIQQAKKNNKRRIVSAINIFNLRNEAPSAKDINVIADSATSQKLYAARDIPKEEEILMHYDVYSANLTTLGVKGGEHLLKNYATAHNVVWNEIGLGHMNIVSSSRSPSPPVVDGQERGSHNYYEPVWPKPNGWESFTLKQIKDHFECTAYVHNKNKPLPTMRDWELFRDAYQREVDDTRKFDDVVPPTMGYTFGDNNNDNGKPPPFYLKREEAIINKGPGLFASRNISKGELVHDGTRSNVMFPDATSWRRFIFALPRNRACDMMEWSWTQAFDEGGTLTFDIFAAIDISVFLGSGRVWGVTNVGREPPSSRYYATSDIGKDEAILAGVLSVSYGALL